MGLGFLILLASLSSVQPWDEGRAFPTLPTSCFQMQWGHHTHPSQAQGVADWDFKQSETERRNSLS